MRLIARFLGFVFATGAILFVIGAAAAGVVIWKYQKDLPDYTQLKTYEPPVMSRVHASDGSLVAEYAHERRLYLPSAAIPPLVKQAFMSAEDKNFYTHNGVDFEGIGRAAMVLIEGNKHIQGASTITQQVAKNFLLTNERSFDRKIKEAMLAFRIESAYSKEKILELYLNEIYLGLGNYGVAAAALNYFDKSVVELTVAEVAYLAALPKAPNNYQPFTKREKAVDRRNWVIDRMVENGYVTREDGEKAKLEPLGVNPRVLSPNTYAAGYFAEEVRRELSDRYGEKKLYEGGLSVRTTLDPQMQVWARKALVDGLVRFDESRGWRGAIRHVDLGGDWGVTLASLPALEDVQPWRLAIVLNTADTGAEIGLQPGRDKAGEVVRERQTGQLPAEGIRWTGKRVRGLLSVGDIVYVDAVEGKPGQYRLRQVPDISGALVAMDPYTGRVFAMAGGFSFDQSEFNRATQALRQPGSSFKPFVYATALDNGYTPSSVVMDAPIEVDQGPGLGIWRPENDDDEGSGPHTLRYGVEHSRNLMTVRLAKDIGMPLVVEYAKRFGVYDDMLPVLSMSLGAGERQAHQADPDRPDPGPLGPHHLPARRAGLRGLRCREVDRPERAAPARQARAGARPHDGLPGDLDPRGRHHPRHRAGHQGAEPASRGQDRDHQRRQGRVVRGLFDRPRGRPLPRLRPAPLAWREGLCGPIRRPGVPRLHAHGAEGQARRPVPRAARHQADLGRLQVGDARQRRGVDAGGLQAGHRPARQLFGDRRCLPRGRTRRRQPRHGPGRRLGHGRALLRLSHGAAAC